MATIQTRQPRRRGRRPARAGTRSRPGRTSPRRLGVSSTRRCRPLRGQRPASCCTKERPQRAARREGECRAGDGSSSSTRAYMQIILLVAAVISHGHRPVEHGPRAHRAHRVQRRDRPAPGGQGQSAMNALKSLMKQTARVRRDGAEAEVPAEEVVRRRRRACIDGGRRRGGRRADRRGAARWTSTSRRSPGRARRRPEGRRMRWPTPSWGRATGPTWRS